MVQTTVVKKAYIEKPVKKVAPGVYAVKSDTHKQLWYTVSFDPETNKVSCPCKGWKFGGGNLCRHMYKVMNMLEGISV